MENKLKQSFTKNEQIGICFSNFQHETLRCDLASCYGALEIVGVIIIIIIISNGLSAYRLRYINMFLGLLNYLLMMDPVYNV